MEDEVDDLPDAHLEVEHGPNCNSESRIVVVTPDGKRYRLPVTQFQTDMRLVPGFGGVSFMNSVWLSAILGKMPS